MRLLIDTQCWLWMSASPERLSKRTQELLRDAGTERLLSVASIWELAIKYQLGKISLPVAPLDFVPSRLETTQTDGLAISAAHALRVGVLPRHHRDPFDRMIAAQAIVEGIHLVSIDDSFDPYFADTEVKRIW